MYTILYIIDYYDITYNILKDELFNYLKIYYMKNITE